MVFVPNKPGSRSGDTDGSSVRIISNLENCIGILDTENEKCERLKATVSKLSKLEDHKPAPPEAVEFLDAIIV